MTRFLAIDPGASGGFAWRDINGGLRSCPMPDSEQIVVETLGRLRGVDMVIMEKVGGFIAGAKTPGSHMFNFGCGYGLIKGAMIAYGMNFQMVTPQEWQKALQLGKKKDHKYEAIITRGKNKGKKTMKSDWKEHLLRQAQLLYPQIEVDLKTADALLMLNYAEQFL